MQEWEPDEVQPGLLLNDAAAVRGFAIGTKHGNPCGAAVHESPAEAIRQMVMGDPRAIFGGKAGELRTHNPSLVVRRLVSKIAQAKIDIQPQG